MSDAFFKERLAPYLRSMYAALHLEILSVGIQLVLCIYGLAIFNSTTSGQLRKQRLPYVIISFVILTLFSVSYVTDSIIIADVLVGGLPREEWAVFAPWYGLLGSICNLLVNFIGDGLLIYRCYVIWTTHQWALAIPVIAYMTSISFGIVFTVSTYVPMDGEFSSGWMAVSVFVNICVTAMISFRIIQTRRRLAKVLAPSYLAKYTGIIAILVESALPYSAFGIVGAVFYTNAHLKQFPATSAIVAGWYCLSALCPQFIIFRVLAGSSFVNDLDGSGNVSQPIVFARGEDSKPDANPRDHSIISGEA